MFGCLCIDIVMLLRVVASVLWLLGSSVFFFVFFSLFDGCWGVLVLVLSGVLALLRCCGGCQGIAMCVA